METHKKKLPKLLTIWNGDRTIVKNKQIDFYMKLWLIINNQLMKIKLMIVDLGKPSIILEIPWLKRYNPTIDWEKKTLKWKNEEVSEKLIDFQKEED